MTEANSSNQDSKTRPTWVPLYWLTEYLGALALSLHHPHSFSSLLRKGNRGCHSCRQWGYLSRTSLSPTLGRDYGCDMVPGAWCLAVTLPVHNWNQGRRGHAEAHLAPKLEPSLSQFSTSPEVLSTQIHTSLSMAPIIAISLYGFMNLLGVHCPALLATGLRDMSPDPYLYPQH